MLKLIALTKAPGTVLLVLFSNSCGPPAGTHSATFWKLSLLRNATVQSNVYLLN